MIETLIGTLFGGIFRLAPEAIKFFDRKDERKHELGMFDKQLEADKLRGQIALEQARVEAEGKLGAAEMQAIIAATKAQGMRTGIKWVDAINSLMRPLITFWWVIVLYTLALYAQYDALIAQGHGGLSALLELWSVEEKSIAASIISFWFVDRSLRKGAGLK